MKKNEYISISANILFGKPGIKGRRIGVEQILFCLAEGWTYKKIVKEFSVSDEAIKACINLYHQPVS